MRLLDRIETRLRAWLWRYASPEAVANSKHRRAEALEEWAQAKGEMRRLKAQMKQPRR